MPEAKTALNVAFGSMTFGEAGTNGNRVSDLETAKEILDIFQSHGHVECDSARTYCEGTTEKMLGELDWQRRGLVVHTKLFPSPASGRVPTITHSPEDLRKNLELSLRDLRTDSLALWYLHAPDHSTPFEVTFETVNQLHKEGKFKELGISNYAAWEVAQICEMCRQKGWIQPTVYQGIYNALHRSVEAELLPCLRSYELRFYEFNPLVSGFLNKASIDDKVEKGSRFDPNTKQGSMYRKRYWSEAYFQAADIVKKACQKEGITANEASLRWIMHHSHLKRKYGDTILIGASSVAHIKENLIDLEKGPLPQSILDAFDQGWSVIVSKASQYFR